MLFLVLQEQVIQIVMLFHEITPLLIRGNSSCRGFIILKKLFSLFQSRGIYAQIENSQCISFGIILHPESVRCEINEGGIA